MARLPSSWWDALLDGKLHHIERGQTPYGSIASLRSAAYREAAERGLKVRTKVSLSSRLVSIQVEVEGPVVTAFPVTMDQAMTKAQAEVQAAGLDPYDVDLVEERTYCTCGLGNATGDRHHEPSCQVWG